MLSSKFDARTFNHMCVTIGKQHVLVHRVIHVGLVPDVSGTPLFVPFRLSKTLLEDVWDALRLLSGVASMIIGALGLLLGCSWLALASLLLAFEFVLLS